MSIEKIKDLSYLYDFKEGSLPEITPKNLKIIVNKINEIIELTSDNINP